MEPSGVTLSPRTFTTPRRRAPRFAALAAVAVIAAGCQSPATSPSPPPAGTTAPSAGPSGPSTTEEPSAGLPGLFHLVGTTPVIPRTMFQNRGAILPAAITPGSNATYHAWVVAFGDPPGTQEIHYLTSPDATTWTEVEDPSLTALSDGLGNPGALPTSVVETADGWLLYLTGTLSTQPDSWEIWRAVAPAPGGPWVRDADPVLRRGPAGAWDSGGLDFPTVVATADGYSMFFSGIPSTQRETGAIGLATSTDGIAWTKHDDPATTDARFAESDPVVQTGLCGGFDERAIHQPRVVAQPAGLVMAYAGYAGDVNSRPAVGYADSLDGGVTWSCEWPGNALDPSGLPAGDGVHTINAFQRGERLALLVEWLADGGTDVWLADLGLSAP